MSDLCTFTQVLQQDFGGLEGQEATAYLTSSCTRTPSAHPMGGCEAGSGCRRLHGYWLSYTLHTLHPCACSMHKLVGPLTSANASSEMYVSHVRPWRLLLCKGCSPCSLYTWAGHGQGCITLQGGTEAVRPVRQQHSRLPRSCIFTNAALSLFRNTNTPTAIPSWAVRRSPGAVFPSRNSA